MASEAKGKRLSEPDESSRIDAFIEQQTESVNQLSVINWTASCWLKKKNCLHNYRLISITNVFASETLRYFNKSGNTSLSSLHGKEMFCSLILLIFTLSAVCKWNCIILVCWDPECNRLNCWNCADTHNDYCF